MSPPLKQACKYNCPLTAQLSRMMQSPDLNVFKRLSSYIFAQLRGHSLIMFLWELDAFEEQEMDSMREFISHFMQKDK